MQHCDWSSDVCSSDLGRRQWHPTPVLLPGKSHGRRSLVDCSPWGLEGSDTTERLPFHISLSCIGEGNGNPLQCSCLENPRDSRAWCRLWGRIESDMTERLPFPFSLSCTGEGNGNPLQCSCLVNPGDGGAWWAATVYGVTQSRTRLKRLSSSSRYFWFFKALDILSVGKIYIET